MTKNNKQSTTANQKLANKAKETATAPIAKSSDGTVQVNIAIAWATIQKEQTATAQELGKKIAVPGFRKGNAPLDRVITHIPKDTLVEKTLQKILPKLFAEAIETHKIKPIIFPRFEILKAEEGADWEVRAITCEMPVITLGDYKASVKGALATNSIWTPDKDNTEKPKEKTREEKEQEVLKALLTEIKFDVPAVLVDEEVNSRLSTLLERLEKLGISLENYLASINKTPQALRDDYGEQSKDAIRLDILLNKIADEENLNASEDEVHDFIHASQGDQELAKRLHEPDQVAIIRSVLKKRKVLDMLISLA